MAVERPNPRGGGRVLRTTIPDTVVLGPTGELYVAVDENITASNSHIEIVAAFGP